MRNKSLSIAFQTNKHAKEYIDLAKLVNQFSFDMVSVYCDAPYHPSFGPLMLMAPYLTQARIGPAAVSPFRFNPIDIAAEAALLADLAKGGIYLGLARGAWLADHGIHEPGKPIQGMREAIDIIQALLDGKSGGYQGEVFNISPHVRAPYPLPETKIPLMIGTWGKKLAHLAGEMADEVKIGGSANPAMAKYLQRYIRKGEKSVERREGSVDIVMGAVCVVDEDRDIARKIARRQVALYLPVVLSLDTTLKIDPELGELIGLAVKQADLDRASDLISDEVLNLFCFSGDVDDIVRQVLELFDHGVSRVEFGTPHGATSKLGIHLLGKEVLPKVRSSQ